VPVKTPADVVKRLNAQVREGLQTPDLQKRCRRTRSRRYQSPEEFAAILKADIAHWGPIVKATGFKAEE
jgi:tripartite-type tricarboxylate transporter receptor subunit TctC